VTFRRSLIVPIAMSATGLALLAVVVGTFNRTPSSVTRQVGSSPQSVTAPDSLTLAIDKAQARLQTLPRDDQTWAQLGSAYVQQARVTGDPTYYPKAQGALQRSLALRPKDNWPAMIGMGSLANARHEFSAALSWARQARAVNAYNSSVYGVMDDALTQLGDYPGATAAAQKMLSLEPGIPAFTRASYHFEEIGRPADARQALNRALAEATDPADVAFCRYYLGELAFNQGDPQTALKQQQLGLVADPGYDPLLAGRAKAEAALGQNAAALRDYATVISRVPQPQYVLENGELLQSLGRADEAAQQYQLLAVEGRLLAANGVVDDLTAAVVDADHGSATAAVRHAEAEWARRKSVLVADALGWALHRAGRDTEALTYAEQADRLGWQNATFAFHRGMIERALGHRAQAHRQLARALKINPHFSVLQAPVARRALIQTSATTGTGD
jgi:tetratricopeptide (TPR) repeat protein